MGQLLAIRPPYYRAHQIAPERWAVVHAMPGHPHLMAIDVDGFHTLAAAEHIADHMNIERDAAQQRLRDEDRLCGIRWQEA
jgi:hypothetical protein